MVSIDTSAYMCHIVQLSAKGGQRDRTCSCDQRSSASGDRGWTRKPGVQAAEDGGSIL